MTPRAIRKIILEQSKRAHVGHIGSALSVVEIIASLYGEVLNIPDVTDPAQTHSSDCWSGLATPSQHAYDPAHDRADQTAHDR